MFDPLDGWGQHRGVGRVAGLDVVVDHDAVFVVDDLGLVAELDRAAEAALHDGAGVGAPQRHHPGRALRRSSGHPSAALLGDPFGPLRQLLQPGDLDLGPGRRSVPVAEGTAGVAGHRPGLSDSPLGDAGQFPVDPADLVQAVIGTAAQVGVDRPRPGLDTAGPVGEPGPGCEPGGLELAYGAGNADHALGHQPGV